MSCRGKIKYNFHKAILQRLFGLQRAMKKIATLSLFLSLSALANEAIIKNTYFDFKSSQMLTLENPANKHLDMVLVVDQNSKWSDQKVIEQINKTQKSLSHCGVQLKVLEIIKVDLPQKTLDQILVQNPYAGMPELKIIAEGKPENIIVGFLNRKIKKYGSAFAVNITSVKRSEQVPSIPSSRPLLNTFWISDNNIEHTSTPNALPSYSTMAHEIAHIAGDLGHLQDNLKPNLMGGNDAVSKSDYLNPTQCEKINSFSLLY
ncbi:MAG: hypothetical protein CME62_13975 [Halobacteriovoraceae bacterium]|nr:hypothetical protein [Halobacteriovoraceae bacterium]